MSRTSSPLVYVMHAYHEPLSLMLDTHSWSAPSLEPVEVSEGDFYAQQLVNCYGPVYGLIIIPSVRTRTGISIDVEAAEVLAKAALKKSEDELLQRWVLRQQTERVKAGLPVLPPTGRVDEIIRNRGLNLQRVYNINPVGYEYTPPDADPSYGRLPTSAPGAQDQLNLLAAKDAEIEALKADNTAKDQIINERLAALEAVIA